MCMTKCVGFFSCYLIQSAAKGMQPLIYTNGNVINLFHTPVTVYLFDWCVKSCTADRVVLIERKKQLTEGLSAKVTNK